MPVDVIAKDAEDTSIPGKCVGLRMNEKMSGSGYGEQKRSRTGRMVVPGMKSVTRIHATRTMFKLNTKHTSRLALTSHEQ